MRKLRKDSRAATAVEYGLIASLMGAGLIIYGYAAGVNEQQFFAHVALFLAPIEKVA